MFGPSAVKGLVLKLIDETLGRKFKVVDEITDVFQGLEPDVKDLKNISKAHEDRLDNLTDRINNIEKKCRCS